MCGVQWIVVIGVNVGQGAFTSYEIDYCVNIDDMK